MAHTDLSCLTVVLDLQANLLAEGVAAQSGLKVRRSADRLVVYRGDAIPLLNAASSVIGCYDST